MRRRRQLAPAAVALGLATLVSAADERTDGTGLHRAGPLRAGRTVVLVHGLEANAGGLARMRAAFESAGVQALWFDYPNDGPVDAAGERLSDELKRLHVESPELKVVLVGHSMGGLVARAAVEPAGRDPGNVTDLVCLGTPHRGSALAKQREWAELASGGFWGIVRQLLTLTGGAKDGRGEAGDDLTPGSRFLCTLARGKRPAGVRYHVAAGRKGPLSAERQAALVRKAEDYCRVNHVAEPRRRELLEIAGAEEFRNGAGDGAVTLKSALLDGADCSRTFDCGHSDLLALPGETPQGHAVFLWMLETLGWKP